LLRLEHWPNLAQRPNQRAALGMVHLAGLHSPIDAAGLFDDVRDCRTIGDLFDVLDLEVIGRLGGHAFLLLGHLRSEHASGPPYWCR
jgi:hypothetical protein